MSMNPAAGNAAPVSHSLLDEPRWTDEQARSLFFNNCSAVTTRRYRAQRKLGYYVIAGEVIYGQHHIEDFLRNVESTARRR